MLKYYEQRRPEYEDIYTKPERQSSLAQLQREICRLVTDRRVLELACGTGYWTRRISPVAESVRATDASAELARTAVESCEGSNVQSGVVDAFAIPSSPAFNCIMAGFFFSHVHIEQRSQFLTGVASALQPDSTIVLFDNRFVKGSSTPISRQSESGDTFQVRALSDGSTFEVLKNFPKLGEVEAALSEVCSTVTPYENEYFWLVSGELHA